MGAVDGILTIELQISWAALASKDLKVIAIFQLSASWQSLQTAMNH